MLRVSGFFVALAFACLFAADISITTLDPWTEMQRMGLGVVTPDFTAVSDIGWVLVRTLSLYTSDAADETRGVGRGGGVGGKNTKPSILKPIVLLKY